MSKVNKITLNGEILIDLTSDTVTPNKLVKGFTAHDKRGELITGTLESNVGSSGVPIKVATLPTPTADCVGKVYFNQADGNYYVGGQSSGEFSIGSPLGNKIYFDTSVKLSEYMPTGEQLPFLSASDATGTNMFGLMGMNDPSMGLCMVLPLVENSGEMLPIGVAYIDSDTFTLEQFNEMVAPELGLPAISNFGWQTDVVDISEFADYVVQMNDLANFGNFAYGDAQNFFNNMNQIDGCADGTIGAVSSNALSVRQYAFYWCERLMSVQLPNATSIGERAFFSCGSLATVDCPNVTHIANLAFSQCYFLREINFPKLETLGEQVFGFAKKVRNVYLPKLKTVSQNTFTSCEELRSAIVPNASLIQARAFAECHPLTKVVVGTNLTTVATLVDISSQWGAFSQCYHILGTVNSKYNPDGLQDGYIYVPLSLVADYRVATNWSTYATQIMPYVATVDELSTIDGTTYDKACVGTDYTEYTYDGTSWQLYTR